MVRERTPAKRPVKSTVGDSWVVDSDGDDEHESTQEFASRHERLVQKPPPSNDGHPSPRKHKQKRKTRSSVSAEPELSMPFIEHNGSVSGSWIGEEKEQIPHANARPRQHRASPPSERAVTYPRSKRDSVPQPTVQDRIEAAFEFLASILTPILRWVFDVLGDIFQGLKTPITYILLGYILVGFIFLLKNFALHSISTALSPICRIPGLSYVDYFGLPFCHSSIPLAYNKSSSAPPVQFAELISVQDKFDEILREAAGGATLPMDMKRGEVSIRDLRQLVKYSSIRSRNELDNEFEGFIETARIASMDLQRFNSHVGRSVDNILATARWTHRVLDGITERDAGKGYLNKVSEKLLRPFQPVVFNEEMLLEQYLLHTGAVEEEVIRLTEEAMALLKILANLEDRLDVIHGITVREHHHVKGNREEVLGQLWTMLGGNQAKLGKFESQVKLLAQVNNYRQSAIAHVSGTLLKLQGMSSELEGLRDRVGGVELLGTKGPMSLRLHVENIELGVERLEKGRKGAKELEQEEMRKRLDREREGGMKMIE